MILKENKNVELSEQEIKNQNLKNKVKSLKKKIVEFSNSNLLEENNLVISHNNLYSHPNLFHSKKINPVNIKLHKKCFSPESRKKLIMSF